MFYSMRDTVSACIQGVGVSIQVGHRIFGWAPKNWSSLRGKLRPTQLVLFAPATAGCRPLFRLMVLGHGISFAPRFQEGGSYSWPGSGLQVF